MKRIRLIALFLVVALMIGYSRQTIQARMIGNTQSTKSVPVSYTHNSKYSLSVHVSGQGTVVDGSQSIRNGIVQYDFQSPTQKQFILQPDVGYYLKKVTCERAGLNTESLMEQVINNIITIEVEDDLVNLYIEFESITAYPDGPAQPGENDSTTGSGSHSESGNVNTGDMTNSLYGLGVVSSLAGLILIGIKKKSKEGVCNDTYKR